MLQGHFHGGNSKTARHHGLPPHAPKKSGVRFACPVEGPPQIPPVIVYLLAAFLVFTPIFFRLPIKTIEVPRTFSFVYQYNLEKDEGTHGEMPPWNGVILPYTAFDGERTFKSPVKSRRLEPSDLAFAPFLGQGYFRYQKVGKEIQFHSAGGELLWRKPFQSYPVSDHTGKLVLLLTGDNNRVEVLDWNGNPVGIKSVAGNFMTDVNFAARAAAACVVFGGGEIYLIDGNGNLKFSYTLPLTHRPRFVKSCAVMPDGQGMAVHALDGPEDAIFVFLAKDGRAVRDWAAILPEIIPQTVQMAVNDHGVILAARRSTTFYRAGAPIWKRDVADQSGYRPVYADRDWFAVGTDRTVLVLDARGRALASVPVTGSAAFRILPSSRPGEFAVQSNKAVSFYAYR